MATGTDSLRSARHSHTLPDGRVSPRSASQVSSGLNGHWTDPMSSAVTGNSSETTSHELTVNMKDHRQTRLGTSSEDFSATASAWHPFRSEALSQRYLAAYDAHAARWPVASDTHFVETSFGETFVRVQGPPDGPPLVLLHGDSENSLAWIPIIAALSERYRTYVLDHIYDHGRSRYTRAPKDPGDLTQWLDEFLTELGLEDVHLMGHSYGGWQAALYARDHPDKLASLVLLSPVGTILPQPIGLLVRAILYGLLPWRWVSQRYMYWYDSECAKDEKTRWLIDEIIDEDLLARRCLKPRKLILPTVLSDTDWTRIAAPMLYMVGDYEVSYSVEAAVSKLCRVAPQVITALAPAADHHIAIVKPDWVVEHVLRFLHAQDSGHDQQAHGG